VCAVRGGGGIERRPRFFCASRRSTHVRLTDAEVTNMLASCFFLKTGIIHHSQ
jgi:hypothetical protein